MSINDVFFVYVKGNTYRIQFCYMGKNDAISIMNNSNLFDKKVFYNLFYQYIINEWSNLLSNKQKCDKKRAKDYYENDKERYKYIKIYIDIDIREQARYKLRKFSEEEKKENREYGRNKYHNMPELKEQKLKEYQKHYRQAKKLK